MNRLWVKLSIAFSVAVLAGFFLIGSASALITQRDVLAYFLVRQLQAQGGLIDQLEEYYRQNQSWDGVQTILSRENQALPRLDGIGIVLSLNDNAGNPLYNVLQEYPNLREGEIQRLQAFSIMVDGEIRGFLVINRIARPLPHNLPPLLLEQLSSLLLVLAGVGGLLGVVAGTISSRILTAPLSQLANVTRAFTHNRKVRAEIKGSEEIVAVARAFNEMADSLEKSEQLRRNLVADAAHELRTPLTVLRANLQAILDGVYPLNRTEIEGLLHQTDLLSHLVSDLHELGQAEARQLPMQPDMIDLNILVETAGNKFRTVAEAHELKLYVEISSVPIIVSADVHRMMQVLNNLLQNALTHTPSGGAITLSLYVTNHKAAISVQDTGIGIAPEHLAHVFERFYRVDRSRNRATGGAGLGLAIVKAIVEMHGGQISVSSKGLVGQGATFTIMLPVVEMERLQVI
jgi:two-component system, OmpR family, sensor histidine kinase BaeS